MDDAVAISALAAELGYDKTPAAMRESLQLLAARPDHFVAVAESEGGVVAWAHAAERFALESPVRIEILGMVVTASRRSQGIGEALVGAVEEWSMQRGIGALVVRSNTVREAAHRFYQRLGYQPTKTALNFTKLLALPPAKN